MPQDKIDIFQILKSTWFLVLFILGVVITAVRLQSNVESQGVRLTKVESEVKDQNTTIANINLSLQKINTTLEFIKDKIK